MAYIQVEASVRTHRKFLRAGPAASWLWLCGIGYCQDGLTDGFIPAEALDFLGVKEPAALVDRLVAAGLWDTAEGGWQVHDYDHHNKLAEEILRIKAERAAGGFLGGRPLKKPPRKPPDKTSKVNLTENPSVPTVTSVPTVPDRLERSESTRDDSAPFEAWFRELREAYPEKSRTAGHLTEHAFLQVFERDQRDPTAVFRDLMAALENQKTGEQWAVKRMVPKLEKWLREGLYTQRHEPVVGAAAESARQPWYWQHCPHTPKCNGFRECSDLKRGVSA